MIEKTEVVRRLRTALMQSVARADPSPSQIAASRQFSALARSESSVLSPGYWKSAGGPRSERLSWNAVTIRQRMYNVRRTKTCPRLGDGVAPKWHTAEKNSRVWLVPGHEGLREAPFHAPWAVAQSGSARAARWGCMHKRRCS